MKAIVVAAPDRVSLEEVETPSCGAQDVLIRTHRTGICATDLKILHGLMPEGSVTYPLIPGHEFSGTVAEVGSEVTDLAPGTRVVAEGRVPCLHCPRCLAGDTNLCDEDEQIGFTRSGALAEYLVAPRRVVHPIADALSFEAAALIEPAASVVRAVERVALEDGESVGVIGVGTLGSIALKLAVSHAPSLLCAYGITSAELERATRIGATEAFDNSTGAAIEATRNLAPGGLDVVIEAAGSAAAVESAFQLVRPGGRIALLGSPGTGQTVSLDADALMRKDVSLYGCLSYTSRAWAQTLELLANGSLKLDDLVEETFAPERFADAFAALEGSSSAHPKVMLEFP